MRATHKVAPKLLRNAVLRNSTQILTPAAKAALGDRYAIRLADGETTLPVEHRAGDRSPGAIDESYAVRGTGKSGDIIITRAPGLLANNLLVQGAIKHGRALATAKSTGKWISPYPKYAERKDMPIADPGSALYMVAPEDMAKAVRAHTETWAPSPDPVMREFEKTEADAVIRTWQGQAALDEVRGHVEGLGYSDPHGRSHNQH